MIGAGLRQILRLQWTSYWRRFLRAGSGAKNNLVVLGLIAIGMAARYVSLLQGVVAEARKGRLLELDLLAAGVFAVCASSVWESGNTAMGARELARFPLTARERSIARIWGGMVSPLAWVAVLFACAIFWPLAVSKYPACAVAGGLALLCTAVMSGFAARHFWATATGKKFGYAALMAALIAAAILWLQLGRGSVVVLNYLPTHLLVLAARGSWWSCGALVLLAMAASFAARYSLTWMLEHAPATVSRKTVSSTNMRVFKKDLRYFRSGEKLLWLVLAGLVFYLATAAAPEPDAARAVLAFTSVLAVANAMNSFGPDGPEGFDRYGLWPLRASEIMGTKNRAMAALAAVRWGPVLVLACWRFGWREGMYDTVEAGALLLGALAWGNVTSVRTPYVGEEASSVIDQVIGLAASGLPGALTIGILRAGGAGVPYAMFGMLAFCAVAYALGWRWSARYYTRNFDAMRERLS